MMNINLLKCTSPMVMIQNRRLTIPNHLMTLNHQHTNPKSLDILESLDMMGVMTRSQNTSNENTICAEGTEENNWCGYGSKKTYKKAKKDANKEGKELTYAVKDSPYMGGDDDKDNGGGGNPYMSGMGG